MCASIFDLWFCLCLLFSISVYLYLNSVCPFEHNLFFPQQSSHKRCSCFLKIPFVLYVILGNESECNSLPQCPFNEFPNTFFTFFTFSTISTRLSECRKYDVFFYTCCPSLSLSFLLSSVRVRNIANPPQHFQTPIVHTKPHKCAFVRLPPALPSNVRVWSLCCAPDNASRTTIAHLIRDRTRAHQQHYSQTHHLMFTTHAYTHLRIDLKTWRIAQLFARVSDCDERRRCRACGKIVCNVRNHYYVHFPGRYTCRFCKAVYTRSDTLLMHARSKHPQFF